MNDLKSVFKQACDIIDSLGIPRSKSISLGLYSRYSTSTYAHCKHGSGEMIIEFNQLVVKRSSPEFVLDTMLHEILHTCPGCMNHGRIWSQYALKVNTLGYNVTHYKTILESGILSYLREDTISLKCECCGEIVVYSRKPRWYNRLSGVTCGMCKTKGQIKLYRRD